MSARSEEGRFESYKNCKRNEIQKKKRFESSIQLRKDKRCNQLQKRRNITSALEHVTPLQEHNNQTPKLRDQITDIEDIVNGVFADHDKSLQLLCTQSARKILSRERNPPIDIFIQKNTIQKFAEFLSWTDNSEMLFEAAWALTNVASGTTENTKAVVEAGAVPALIDLLVCGHYKVAEQALWALGNIAGDSPELRNFVLKSQILPNLLILGDNVITSMNNKVYEAASLAQNLAWTLSNLCRNRYPCTELQYVEHMVPLLLRLLFVKDLQTQIDTSWAFSYITDGTNNYLTLVLQSAAHIKLINMIEETNDTMLAIPIIRCLGNIITGSDQQTQEILDRGFFRAIRNWTLKAQGNTLQKELAWVMSNILAGNNDQIQALLNANFLPWLVDLCHNADFKTRKEAAWALTNLAASGTLSQKEVLVQHQGVEAICSMLNTEDSKIVEVCLVGLTNLLKAFEEPGFITHRIEECMGMDKIEELQCHKLENIYKLAFTLIDTYFSEEHDENAVTSTTGSAFNFVTNNGDNNTGFSF